MRTHLWTWNYTCVISPWESTEIKTKTISCLMFNSQILQNAEMNIIAHWKFWRKYGSDSYSFSCKWIFRNWRSNHNNKCSYRLWLSTIIDWWACLRRLVRCLPLWSWTCPATRSHTYRYKLVTSLRSKFSTLGGTTCKKFL